MAYGLFQLDLDLKLVQGSIGTSPMYGIGSPPKKYKDTSLTLMSLTSLTRTLLASGLKVMVGVGGVRVWGLGTGLVNL